jgi:hypothetical protein
MTVYKLVDEELRSINAPAGRAIRYAIGRREVGEIYVFTHIRHALRHRGRVLRCEGEGLHRARNGDPACDAITPIEEVKNP